MLDYVRRLRLKEYFCGDEDVGGDFLQKPAFRKKSSWCPDRSSDFILETYVDMLERKIFSHDLRVHYQRNISKEEQEELENLRGYDDIVIKQADSGSAVVVMHRKKYVDEAMRQLNDKEVSIPLKKNPTAEMMKKINARINRLHGDGYISDSTLQYLLINSDARAGRFYLLPKIHKMNCPGRPVISGCSMSGEEQLQEFLQWINQYHNTIKFTWDWSKKNVTILMYRLLIIMPLLKPICILSQLISISIYSIPRATQRGVKKAFLMCRLLGSGTFVLRLWLLSIGQLILGSI